MPRMADGRDVMVDIRADRECAPRLRHSRSAGSPGAPLPQSHRGKSGEHEPQRSGLVEISISIDAKSPMSEPTRDQ